MRHIYSLIVLLFLGWICCSLKKEREIDDSALPEAKEQKFDELENADPEITVDDFCTAVFQAADENTFLGDYVLKNAKNVEDLVNGKDKSNHTPLYHAVSAHSAKAVKLLVDLGAKVASEEIFKVLQAYPTKRTIKVLEQVLKAVNVEDVLNQETSTSLIDFTMTHNLLNELRLLVNAGARATWLIVFKAVTFFYECPEYLELVLSAKNVKNEADDQDSQLYVCIGMAISARQINAVRMLIDVGARVCWTNIFEALVISEENAEFLELVLKAKNVKEQIDKRNYHYIGDTPVHVAFETGLDNGDAPIHVAVEKGLANAISLLIKAGADVNLKDSHGFTVLQRAKIAGRAEIIAMLQNENARD